MIRILFSGGPEDRWATYSDVLPQALEAAGIEAEIRQDWPPEQVDYIVYAPNEDLTDFSPYVNCKAVLNLWAGVEGLTKNDTLTQPLTRMVDRGLTEGMVEWVTGHVLRHHLGMDAHIVNPDHEWNWAPPPLARKRPVTMLGLGELGEACARSLAALNFPVTGWSRSLKDIDGITCVAGDDGLAGALAAAEIVVLLLPLTPETRNLMDAERLAGMKRGAVLINPGRGPLIDDDALLAALDDGQIAHATLDVFREEPLPRDHPYWAHPRVTVTPHIASATRPDTAAEVIAENIRRAEAGEPLLYRVDRDAGY
ncbi:glyoxylate/hydroxypyruvate reductase A [Psychromarinibacter sp. C21-152]|uniref:Glyoxylate/hydroxypyruvate reductase A n=1 Tax=Psychromarinibacter sediminicola TaxID=3033385 RepID=A0AAE3NVL5_9RHOB|nr:glyoxylate/hydroxypyruvate reductase A [Psychromarinibacter sediminicola]MDF0601785.1 glyoxylate/hydroxypyruvate reductase A [Psychromarinibacter sediminicola]